MGDGITLNKIRENEKELVYASYDEYFDRDTGERTCICGTFEMNKYLDGIKELDEKGTCKIDGIGGIEISISKVPEKNLVSVCLSSGNCGIHQTMNLEELHL
jgi:hypothetical protein